ncbi:hypothetical protein ROZALSC1DRAFT_20500 [Rozella allomycis CSF55]|uniref:Uncharacterized protein n=1 Tax=Rozella allomycis (strain CSF55) TaxID=988480 RepID=A0A4P9YPL2_ROZAC|nr:hypothetical protein ROZALSC1DRAFT_20500 [Rozella allomycis CSF55]
MNIYFDVVSKNLKRLSTFITKPSKFYFKLFNLKVPENHRFDILPTDISHALFQYTTLLLRVIAKLVNIGIECESDSALVILDLQTYRKFMYKNKLDHDFYHICEMHSYLSHYTISLLFHLGIEVTDREIPYFIKNLTLILNKPVRGNLHLRIPWSLEFVRESVQNHYGLSNSCKDWFII